MKVHVSDNSVGELSMWLMTSWCYTAVGMNDLQKRSVLHWGCFSLWLNELLSPPTVSCMVWWGLSKTAVSFVNILLSPTTNTGSRGHPSTALYIFLFDLVFFRQNCSLREYVKFWSRAPYTQMECESQPKQASSWCVTH